MEAAGARVVRQQHAEDAAGTSMLGDAQAITPYGDADRVGPPAHGVLLRSNERRRDAGFIAPRLDSCVD